MSYFREDSTVWAGPRLHNRGLEEGFRNRVQGALFCSAPKLASLVSAVLNGANPRHLALRVILSLVRFSGHTGGNESTIQEVEQKLPGI